MGKKYHVIADIRLRVDAPTDLAFRDLRNWVVWQFPRKKAGGLLGAVRPPMAEHGWFPAIVKVEEKQAQVYAHLEETFSSPEAAVEYLSSASL